jgi:hypothetical protein
MSLVVPVTACLLIFGSLEAIIIAQWAHTESLCVLEGSDTTATGIRGYFPQLLKYQDFWSISPTLKEM